MVNRAIEGSPQLVTRHGHPAVYVISADEYRQYKSNSIKSILTMSPHKDVVLDVERDKDSGREIAL